jgi:hypothetical protein
VIPAKLNCRDPAPHDRVHHRSSSRTERFFNMLREWRRIATRHDETAGLHLGFASLVSALLRLPLSHGVQFKLIRTKRTNISHRNIPRLFADHLSC